MLRSVPFQKQIILHYFFDLEVYSLTSKQINTLRPVLNGNRYRFRSTRKDDPVQWKHNIYVLIVYKYVYKLMDTFNIQTARFIN